MMIDADYILIRPFTNDFSNTPVEWRNQASGKYWTKINHGALIPQQFGFGLVWKWESNVTKDCSQKFSESASFDINV